MTKEAGIKHDQRWTIAKAFEQLEFCDYQTKDGLHDLKMNDAYVFLKEITSNLCKENEGKDKLIESYTTGNCPYCDNVGYTAHQVGEEECQQEQCEWCWTFEGSKFAVNAHKKRIEELENFVRRLQTPNKPPFEIVMDVKDYNLIPQGEK